MVWKKTENENGFLSYINSETNIEQWDHPKFCNVKQAIDDCNYVAYASYRLALKIRVLQRCLSMEEIPLSIVTKVFERHRLADAENSLILETYDLEAVLSDIFFTANKSNHTNIDIDYATEIAINLLYNIFDSGRQGKIQVISCKMTLGLLCSSASIELHKFLFSLCADHNNCITRVRLQGLLNRIHTVMKYLHEDSCFDQKSLNWAVEKCFRDSPGLVGITESNFIMWLNSDVLFLMWLPLVSKLKAAETVISSVKCATCKTRPLLGLRYCCTKCPKYNQCQRCFLTGRISHSHKLTHALREYGCASNVNVSSSYLNKFCDILCLRATRTAYTIVRPIRQLANENIKPFHPPEPISDIEPLSPPEVQLQNVIRQLESQNRELQQLLIFGNQNDKEMRKYLEEYRLFMAGNIQKLKTLKHQINSLSVQEKAEPEIAKCNGKTNLRIDCNGSPLTIMTDLEDSECDVAIEKHEAFMGHTNKLDVPKSPVKVLHNDLDEALAKLQQILANNFTMDDSLTNLDNTNLKYAVTEVEGMLTSIIDNVESSRCNSALPFRGKC